jgi:hypothetical protein
MVTFARKPAAVKCLYLDNGILRIKKVFDVGDTLVYLRGPKVLSWAKGKPIISEVRGLKGSTWLLCPELAWTLDESGLVDTMRKGKAHLLGKLLDRLVEIGKESDGLDAMKEQKDRMAELQRELEEKTVQLVAAQEAAARESAGKITAEAKLQSETEARQRAELAAQQEREKRESLQLTRTPDEAGQDRGSRVSHDPKGSGAKHKPVKGAEKIA